MTRLPSKSLRLLSSFAILSILANMLLGPSSEVRADDGAALSQYLPEVAASDQISAAPLVEGVVTDPDTNAPQKGALVTLEVWPTAESIANLQIGDRIPTTLIAKDETDSKGSYELKVEDRKLLAPYADKDGNLKLEVNVETETGTETSGAAIPNTPKCGTFSGQAIFDSKEATTFSAGVSLQSTIGINLSAKSGRSSGQKAVFKHTRSGTFSICGTTNYPGNDNNGALVAK